VANLAQIESICADGFGLADLWERSPERLEDNRSHAEEILDRLFPGNPLLCCGKAKSVFDTKPRREWRGKLSGLQFIVPSPMTATTGLTKQGKESAHALSITGSRRFLVVECDFSINTRDGNTETRFAPMIRRLTAEGFDVADMCAAVLLHLNKYAPMVCAVHSGGKSIHGWFFAEGQAESTVRNFFRYATSLGADSATWTRSQFVRVPDGQRENGRPQTVFYLDFQPLRKAK
jgi:hypothetical protein